MSINQEEVELEMAERVDLTAKYDALQRLKESDDFKVLILDGYMKDKAVDTTSLLSTEYGRGIRSTLFEELAAISCFEGYLHMIENLGASITEEEEDKE